jgi:hypothetical protein
VRTYKDDLAEIIAEIDALAGDPEAIAGQGEEGAEQVVAA